MKNHAKIPSVASWSLVLWNLVLTECFLYNTYVVFINVDAMLQAWSLVPSFHLPNKPRCCFKLLYDLALRTKETLTLFNQQTLNSLPYSLFC